MRLTIDTERPDRLDRMIARLVPGLSRGAARRLVAAGAVFVNGRRSRIASRLVSPGDVLSLETRTPPAAADPLTILYEDEAVIAVDKPPGMPAAPTRVAALGTASDLLQRQLRRRDRVPVRVWLVHRLDAPASGVIVFAKTRAAARALGHAFRERHVDKVYVAEVEGAVAGETGRIEQPLRSLGRKTVADAGGQPARTDWHVLRRAGSTTLLELRPHTGRMHQLRAHLSASGHPIVGDRLYGGPPGRRLMLHALRIGFAHPEREATLDIASPWPAEFGPAP